MAAYAGGILAAVIVLFLIVWILIWIRRKATGGKVKRSKRDLGRTSGLFYGGRDDVEMTMKS